MAEYNNRTEQADANKTFRDKVNLLLEFGKNNPEKLLQVSYDLMGLAKPELVKKYKLINNKEAGNVDEEIIINIILETFPDHDIRGKVIVDLGCGSTGGTYESDEWGDDQYRQWEPWLCRILHELGAKPIGIDVGELVNEDFEHYSLNLLTPNSLQIIQDESVDMVYTSSFYDSLELQRLLRIRSDDKSREKMRDILFPQIKRILKKNGVFLEMPTSITEKRKIYKKEEI